MVALGTSGARGAGRIDDDAARVRALEDLHILDTAPEAAFDHITTLAAAMFHVPMAIITFVDATRQWFKSRVGVALPETSREIAFCAHTIQGHQLFVVEDAHRDPRFRDNPLVQHDPHVRFYAGAPLRLPSGHVVGSLAILDHVPRVLDAAERAHLDRFAHLVMDAIALRERSDVAIREKHEAQRRESQKLEALGRFAAGIAHDFNNLLSVMLVVGQLAQRKVSAGDPLAADLETILEGARRAAHLTEQLLAIGRRQSMRKERIDLRTLVIESEPLLRRAVGEDVGLAIDLDPLVPPVDADPAQIQRVLMNLVMNARDATPPGGLITIASRLEDVPADEASAHEAHPGRHAVLCVSDTGSGMDAGTRERIFDPFFTTKAEGSGLGLAIVAGIVKQSGGHLSVTSAPGQGSTFAVRLPISQSSGGAHGPS